MLSLFLLCQLVDVPVLADYLPTPQEIQDARGVNGGPKVDTAVPCLDDTPWVTDSDDPDDSELPPASFLRELPPFPGKEALLGE